MTMNWLRKKNDTAPSSDILHGPRIIMRPPVRSDWPAWVGVRGNNKDFLEPFEPTWPRDSQSRDFFERRLERQQENARDDVGYAFLIFKDNELIGGMNINHVCRGASQSASLGYWIAEAQQGQGYMAEALDLTVEYCFEELDLHRVHAACLPENLRSQNLLLRGGFAQEGFARAYMKINGMWQDHVLFGITREAYERYSTEI
jgi:[ribosomal protein S5]-alanine N-acetyltransferase